jgi:hypothetical protein
MRNRWLALSLLLCALPACGGGAPSRSYDAVEPSLDEDVELAEQQLEADRQLSEVLSRPEPDCAAACDLSATICDLGTRICGLSQRNPHSPEIASRCQDSTARCESARSRVAEVCTCAE